MRYLRLVFEAGLFALLLTTTAQAATYKIGRYTVTHTTANLSQARGYLASASIGQKAFFAGGYHLLGVSDVVDVYDANTGTWSTSQRGEVSPLSQARFVHTAASSGGRAFFAGGTAIGPYESKVVDVFDGNGSRIAQTTIYGTSTSGRQNMAAASANGKVYFAGGGSHQSGDWTEFSVDWVDEFDAATLSHSVMHLSMPRSNIMGASIDNYVLFGGGRYIPLGGNFSGSRSRVDIYNTLSGTWTTSELSVPRWSGIATTLAEKVLFAGGVVTDADGVTHHSSSVVDIFDSKSGLWSTSSLSLPRYGLSAAGLDDLAFFAGGFNRETGQPTDVVDIYDQSTGAWSVLHLSTPRTGATGVAVGNVVLFGGGITVAQDGYIIYSDVVDIFTLTEDKPPIAKAGPDQTVNEGDHVILDGSGSSEDAVSFNWTQVAGQQVQLDTVTDPKHPTFIAPMVGAGGETLTFQLVVSNENRESDPDTVDITVKNVNHAPEANIAPHDPVAEGSSVTLDGTGSYDEDNDPLTYHWEQIAGPPVPLSGETTPRLSFTAPSVASGTITLTFELIVSDNDAFCSAQVAVVVEHVNHKPIANAGPPQTVDEASQVILNGSRSHDPDSDPLTYQWVQIGGDPVALTNPTSVNPSFRAPVVGPGGVTLVFQLMVNDGQLPSDPATVKIHVQDTDDPPLCSNAYADLGSLWPPNHKLVPVKILGITDPENEGTTITITGVMQDEPVNGQGEGDSSPDAVLPSDEVMLRAERAGGGNGRVYHLNFIARDGLGQSCQGSVTVCVPHDKKDSCMDGGGLYDSLHP